MAIGGSDNADESQSLLAASSSSSDPVNYRSAELHKSVLDGAALRRGEDIRQEGEEYDNVPAARRQLGLFSAIFLISNSIIGSGIYATPSSILRSSGSIGVSLIMWLIGAFIASCGMAVYVELGTGLPRSGGEKNYLEYIYRRPRFLASCLYVAYALLLVTSAGSSVVFSEYTLHTLSIPSSQFNTRLIAFFCLTFICLIHGTKLKWGLRLQNVLGMLKLFVMSAVALCGLLSLAGVPGFQVHSEYDQPHNFDSWNHFWEGSGTGTNAFVSGLYNVIWSFVGYSNANYVLSEVRNPVKTIKLAAPLALLSVTTIFLLINVAYFAVVSKSDILGSNRIIAALFFRNLFGPTTEKALSAFIAFSTLGNLLAFQFSTGRVLQELGREGILPYASFFASNKPFNTPLSSLFTQCLLSCVLLLAVPAGDAYLFIINIYSYSVTLINTFVALGLLLLYTSAYQRWGWDPPFRAHKIVVLLFFVSNLFLIVAPFIPPVSGSTTYDQLPYWSHSIGGASISFLGIAYWYYWSIWKPKRYRYKLQREWVLQDDGVSRYVFRQVPLSQLEE